MMSVRHSSSRLIDAVRGRDLCSCLASISISHSRALSSTAPKYGMPSFHGSTRRDTGGNSLSETARNPINSGEKLAAPSYKELSPAERAARAAARAREKMVEQQQKYSSQMRPGGLADNSVFYEDDLGQTSESTTATSRLSPLRQGDTAAISMALNPRPNARARWQRKMLIRHVRRRGRLPKQVQIDRTERFHLSKSHFFKTSMKKLAPLARQIAGKSIDEAILQMRFSKKKAAIEVREHLVQAKDEAIVYKGMGLPPQSDVNEMKTRTDDSLILDPAISPALGRQTATKTIRTGAERHETDIYIAQAWVNRGPYGMEPEYRARGRVNILRPPFTGISVLLKEEKTRNRQKAEAEEKTIRKRLGKSMWTQLPDRPIVRQSQQILW